MTYMSQAPETPLVAKTPTEPRQHNAFALASFVLGVITVFTRVQPYFAMLEAADGWLLLISLIIPGTGMLFGWLAFSELRTSPGQTGRQLASAGVLLSAVGMVVMVLTYLRIDAASSPF
jgi:hypothetical protein